MEKWRHEVERILKEGLPVDGPFTTTLDELGAVVCSEFGMPKLWLNQLVVCMALGAQKIIDRKEREEIKRLAVRMYLSGLLEGAKLKRQAVR